MRENSHAVQFTHLKRVIWWFLVYSQSYTSVITVSFRIFLSPQKKPCPLTITFLSSHRPLPQVTSNLNSFCLIVLPILDTSYQWKQPFVSGFSQHNVFKVHSCCSLCRYVIPFYGWIIFHYYYVWIDDILFIHSSFFIFLSCATQLVL